MRGLRPASLSTTCWGWDASLDATIENSASSAKQAKFWTENRRSMAISQDSVSSIIAHIGEFFSKTRSSLSKTEGSGEFVVVSFERGACPAWRPDDALQWLDLNLLSFADLLQERLAQRFNIPIHVGGIPEQELVERDAELPC